MKNLVLDLTQENSIEFQGQNVYLIYVRLLVYSTLILAYSKNYIYYISYIGCYYFSRTFYVLLCDI